MRCEYCDKEDCDGIQREVLNPYMLEVYDEEEYQMMCEGQLEEARRDI